MSMLSRLRDWWRCRRGRHDWVVRGHVAWTHGTGPVDDEGSPTLRVGDAAEVWEQRWCRRCGVQHPDNAAFTIVGADGETVDGWSLLGDTRPRFEEK